MVKPLVFISYSNKDYDPSKDSEEREGINEKAEFFKKLLDKLDENGFDGWLAPEKIEPGKLWREELDNAILKAHALLVIMSPNARGSEYVNYEWAFALGAGVPVAPVIIEKTDLHPALERLQYFDFTAEKKPWDKLIKWVKEEKEIRFVLLKRHPLVEEIIRHLSKVREPSEDDKKWVIESLSRMEGAGMDELLKDILVKPHHLHEARQYAAMRLAEELETDELIELECLDAVFKTLKAALYGAKAHTRERATVLLGKLLCTSKDEDFGDKVEHVIVDALQDKRSKRVRRAAARVLGECGSLSVVPHLADALRDKAEVVRAEAAKSIGMIRPDASTDGYTKAEFRLLSLLDNDDSDIVREEAARALGKLRSRRAVRSLSRKWRDPNKNVRDAAYEALLKIGTSEAEAAARAFRDY